MSFIGFVRLLPSLEVNCAILLVLMLPGALFTMQDEANFACRALPRVCEQVQPPALSLGPVALSNHDFIIKMVIKSVSLVLSVRALERRMETKLLCNS